MKVDAQNRLWETAAGLLGLAVGEVSSRLRRRKNRIEGSIDGSHVSVAYAQYVSGIVVSVTVEPEEAGDSNDYLPPVEMVVPGEAEDPSGLVDAIRQAVAAVDAAVRTIRSAPEASRSTTSYVTSADVGPSTGGSPPLLTVLRDLAVLAPGDGLVVVDTSHPEMFMQAARTESGYEVEYRDGDAASHCSTATEDINSAISLFAQWMSNDRAWTSAADWKPVGL